VAVNGTTGKELDDDELQDLSDWILPKVWYVEARSARKDFIFTTSTLQD
jgi:hypothetical protein